MKYVIVKDDSQLQLPGVDIATERVDGQLKAVSFSVNGVLAFRLQMDSWNMTAQTIAPPVMRKVFRLVGTVIGIPVDQQFETHHKAHEARTKYERGLVDETASTLDIIESEIIATDE